MRSAGALMLAICCFLLGQYLASRISARAKALEAALLMLLAIRTQLEFSAAPVEELLALLCARSGLQELRFLQECRRLCQTGTAFPLAWRIALEDASGALQREDVAHLISFGEGLGTTDLGGQIKSCELYEQLLNENLQAARGKQKQYGKLLPMLGLLGGIALAILLL